MFLKYGQVLDTDGDYTVIYSCQEVAQFYAEKTGMEMVEEDVFKIMMRQREPERPYNVNNFIGLDGIRTEFKNKQKIQIYARPKMNDDGSMTLRPLDNMKLQQLIEDIKNIYIPNGDFS